jgi:hypothetical protein
MALSYVDFIAKNVEVCVKYYVNKEPRWYKGKVVKVLDRYIDDSIEDCVKCIVKYDKDKYTEVFCDKDYNADNENGWCFSRHYTPLVENIVSIVDKFDESEGSEDSEDSENTESNPEIDETGSEENKYHTTDTDSTVESEPLDDNYQQTTAKQNSLMNSIGATLFMLAPWIASAVALFNARKEICNALRD